MTDIQLDYRVPADDLVPFITLFYHFRADVPHFEDTERADHAQLRFRLSRRRSDYTFIDGLRVEAPPIHVIGATSGAVRSCAEGPVHIFGMGLTAAGWAALVGVDASSMLNRVMDGETLFGAPALETMAALTTAPDTDAMIAVIEPAMRGLLSAGDGETLKFVRQVDAWLASAPSPAVDALSAATGLSRRQVERRCNLLYGCPPKLLARKYRALRAAVAIASGSPEAETFIAEGFYDQSHMIREIKQFTGLTPKQMRDAPNVLAQLTIAQRRALGGQVHTLISDT